MCVTNCTTSSQTTSTFQIFDANPFNRTCWPPSEVSPFPILSQNKNYMDYLKTLLRILGPGDSIVEEGARITCLKQDNSVLFQHEDGFSFFPNEDFTEWYAGDARWACYQKNRGSIYSLMPLSSGKVRYYTSPKVLVAAESERAAND